MQEVIEKNFIFTFQSKDGMDFGFRYAKKEDAEDLVRVFKDVYGYNYLYPYVYDPDKIQTHVKSPKEKWTVIEDIAKGKVIAMGMVDRLNERSVYAGKVLLKKDYHGKGIVGILGAKSVIYTFSRPKFKKITRIDSDVRAYNRNSQKFVDNIDSISYGFIPNYNNYADKRDFDISQGLPYNQGKIEPVIMYFTPVKTFWRIRERNITLYDHKEIINFYHGMRDKIRRLTHDKVQYKKNKTVHCNDFSIKEDPYKSHILIKGCLKEKTITHLLEKYHNWNVIEWRVPATMKGVNSQKNALEKGFKVMGYDPGSNYKITHTEDTIVFCAFPNGIDASQFNDLDIFEKNKTVVNQALKAIEN